MTLTGQCKSDFETYFIQNVYDEFYQGDDKYNHPYDALFDVLYKMPEPMKYGLFVDFFDQTSMEDTVQLEISYINGGHTRSESRRAAVEKNNKRYNENR